MSSAIRTPLSEFLRKFRRQRLALVAGMFVALLVLVALFAPWIVPYDPEGYFDYDALNAGPSLAHWFGVDALGRDIFSRVVMGARISLAAGLLSVTIGAVIGTLMGLVAGYYQGWVERIAMRISDVLLAFPGMLLAIGVVGRTDGLCDPSLGLAIDRGHLCHTVLEDSRLPAHAFTPPGTAGYTARASSQFDPEKARQLLAAAGFPGGRGFPVLEVQLKNDAIHRTVLEALQQLWRRELGIQITLAPLEQKTWVANQQAMTYQITSSRWIGDYVDPNTFLDMWVTGGGNNQTGWSQPAYDRLVAESARTLDEPRRHELQQQAESLLLAEAPIAPIFHGTRVFLKHPAVQNWEPTLLGLHRYQFIELAPPATR